MEITLTDDERKHLANTMNAIAKTIHSLPTSAEDLFGYDAWKAYSSWKARMVGGLRCERCGAYDTSVVNMDDHFPGRGFPTYPICSWCYDELLDTEGD